MAIETIEPTITRKVSLKREFYHSRRVMVSGYFDSFHDAHLDYIKQAMGCADFLICIVASDKQVIMKKGKVNIPSQYLSKGSFNSTPGSVGWQPA